MPEAPNVPTNGIDAGAEGYGVALYEPVTDQSSNTVVADIEGYLMSYVTFADQNHALPIALWLAATHLWQTFDAFPYLVITSATKRSAKTRLMELMSFIAAKPLAIADISPAAMYQTISSLKPTLFVDEAEKFSSATSEFRPLLNTGYRRGQKVLRQIGGATVAYETYCPKAFALIGDVYDTLRDRSIVIVMKRGTAKQRFVFAIAQQDGRALRERLSKIAQLKASEAYEAAVSFEGLPFLTDRDEEIWTPIFVMCNVLCPDRLDELTRAAADIATAKTAEARKFTELAGQEKDAEEQEYAERLLLDAIAVIRDRKHATTAELIPALRELPTSPWRKFRGAGLKDGIDGAMDIAALLSRFGVSPKTIRIARKSEKNSTAKGYERDELVRAAELAGLLSRNPVTLTATTAATNEFPATSDAESLDERNVQSGSTQRTDTVEVPTNIVRLDRTKRYVVRPHPTDGFGVYEAGGSTILVAWFATEDAARSAAAGE